MRGVKTQTRSWGTSTEPARPSGRGAEGQTRCTGVCLPSNRSFHVSSVNHILKSSRPQEEKPSSRRLSGPEPLEMREPERTSSRHPPGVSGRPLRLLLWVGPAFLADRSSGRCGVSYPAAPASVANWMLFPREPGGPGRHFTPSSRPRPRPEVIAGRMLHVAKGGCPPRPGKQPPFLAVG